MAAARKVSIAMALALGSLAAGARAHAQALSAPPEYAVEIAATKPGAVVTLRGAQDVWCGERCALNVPQGRYEVVVKDADGYLSTQELLVQMPTSAVVRPPDSGSRKLGIVLMSVGLAGVVVGGVLFAKIFFTKFVETIAQDCSGPCVNEDVATSTWIIAGTSLSAGLVVGLSGLAVYRKNKHAVVETSPLGTPPAEDAFLRLTPAAGPRWAGLGLTGRF